MKRIIPVLLLAFVLAGCASLPNPFTAVSNPFDTPTLAKVETAYGAALSIAVGYRRACAERSIPPSCRPIVKQLQAQGARAQAAVVAARKFVKNYPQISAASAIGAAKAAVEDFKAEQTGLGVN